MTSERWHQVEELYHAALEREPEQRAAFLAQADPELCREVESLLAQETGTILNEPAWKGADSLFESNVRQLSSGAELGFYRIEALIGAGGMGEVYRARDTRLGREVAIKLIRRRFDESADGPQRLLQEARAVSALNHPNIVALYDLCAVDGHEFLVMELVRGKTLDQIIGNRGSAVNKALQYAIPIADALARAHSAGVLHRDLKPSNIMITDDGAPKILDFGLAKLAPAKPVSGSDPALAQQSSQTEQHAIAGTAAYMSPEQAEGKKLDARSDIFSFGAVLYEMLTGRRAFQGESTASIISAVLRHEPEPATHLAPHVPRELERIIQRCLRKDPDRRFHSMSDVKVELEEVREQSESGTLRRQTPTRRRRTTVLYVAAAIASLAVAAVVWRWSRRFPPLLSPTQPVPFTAYHGDEDFPDFSPDGNQVVFTWNGEHRGRYHLYVKPIASTTHLQLTKEDGSDYYPKWSPDGQWIAFERRDPVNPPTPTGAPGQSILYERDTGTAHTFIISPVGGHERKLRDGNCLGLSWSADSKALACGTGSGLDLISTDTGETRQLTSPPKDQFDWLPAFSPDGQKLLFVRGRRSTDCDLYLLELNSDLSARGGPRRITSERASSLVPSNMGAAWTADSRDAIWAMSKGSLYGFTLYRVPVTHGGGVQPLPLVGRNVYSPAASRQGNRLVYSRWSMDIDIWRANGQTAERHPVSSTEVELNPQFSPDGKRIAFESDRSGPQEVWIANSDGSDAVQFTHFGHHCGSPRWSPDGRWIVFDAYMGTGGRDLWVMESGGGKPRRLTNGPGGSVVPSFSRDGKWIYFANDRTGPREVFRVPFAGGAAEQLTHHGGGTAFESADGSTVYYLKRDTSSSAPLCEVPVGGGQEHPLGVDVFQRAFQVMSDGIYFLASTGKNTGGLGIWFYEFAKQRSRLIQALGEVHPHYGLTVSPDRKTFLYSLREDNGRELMLMENFR